MIIIFDLDGTLFQTAYSDINAVNKLFEELGLNRLEEKNIVQNIGKKTDDFLKSILPKHINPVDVKDRFRELEYIDVNAHGRLFDNVAEMLEKLVLNNHLLYICSNGSLEYIKFVLNKTGIEKYFSGVYRAKQFSCKSDVVKQIINDNKKAILIGDTYEDIAAASLNNIPSIGVAYGYGKKGEIDTATFIVQNPIDIIYLINQIEVFYSINLKLLDTGKKIIGINGVDTSGKTYFTLNYSKFLNSLDIKTTILHIDDFHNPSKIRYNGENELDAYYNNAFNYSQVIEEILRPLKSNGSIDKSVICLNLDTDKYEDLIHYSIDKDTILLIEGVLLFREPLTKYIEGKVFLYISFEEVLNRARKRDVPKYGEAFLQKYINKYIPIQKHYLLENNPEKTSDIVINNEDYLNPQIIQL